ncbi:hypothetical protein C9374_013266 [Naegleria lovaniensis]|uniref:D-xylose 1-dehydrogenase (NADP(+), D-xylono-1,5-lactone-forming) n=1 Tax=Naegleria lovaniensis TaxID=51637 RepID=A0AA88H2C4_NAELO|nr:uncharacterized protein C9374_013266 [Naegleria lovaniensis]KAG2391781.1 hypothetical protein C9374_013266 [Naegleria lovaniensis]
MSTLNLSTTDPTVHNLLRFGIFSTGAIAYTFTESLLKNNYGFPKHQIQVVAVVSRELEKAQQFANHFSTIGNTTSKEKNGNSEMDSSSILHQIKAYDDYEQFFNDDSIDIVYIASPHYLHYEHCKMALEHGKNVLCEKAFTINAKEASELIELAKQKNLFLMEGMWTRFFPANQEMMKLIKNGEIGQITHINVSLGFVGAKRQPSKDHRLYKLESGGGSLLDCGVYCISSIIQIVNGIGCGKVSKIQSFMNIDSQTGTDTQCSALIEFERFDSSGYNNSQPIYATFHCSFVNEFSRILEICGSDGIIQVHNSFHRPTSFSVIKQGSTRTYEFPKENDYQEGSGFFYEIKHVLELWREQKIESPIMPHHETLSVMQIMDTIRQAHQFYYPKEKEEPSSSYVNPLKPTIQ